MREKSTAMAAMDNEMQKIYGLKENEAVFEAKPRQAEIIATIAKKMGIKIRIVESKMASPGITVIVESNNDVFLTRNKLTEEVRKELGIK